MGLSEFRRGKRIDLPMALGHCDLGGQARGLFGEQRRIDRFVVRSALKTRLMNGQPAMFDIGRFILKQQVNAGGGELFDGVLEQVADPIHAQHIPDQGVPTHFRISQSEPPWQNEVGPRGCRTGIPFPAPA